MATHPTDPLACIEILPGADPDTSGCPETITLQIVEVPPGIEACFPTPSGGCVQALPLVSTNFEVTDILVSASAAAPLGRANIRVSGSSREPRTVSVNIPIVVSQDVLEFEEPVEVFRGLNVSVPVTVTHPADAPGAMTLSLACDSGITASNVNVAAADTSATLTIRTAANTVVGTHECNILAAISGLSGGLPHPITVIVIDPFNVALDQPSIAVKPGCPPQAIGAAVVRDPGFTAPLSYSVTFIGPVSPLPTLRPEVDIQDAATDTPRLEVFARLGTRAGTYNFRLTSNGGGNATENDNFSVIVRTTGSCLTP